MPAPADTGLTRVITLKAATGLVVANMIGAGIFTTTGYQAADLGHPGLIYALWVIGGVLAFCGALCFAELGAMLPRAGAEYVYIRESYGQALAFVSAFVALTAGFSAPIAAAAKSLVAYMGYLVAPLRDNPSLFGVELADACAIAVVWFLVAVHCRGARSGMRFGDAVTVFKVLGIVAIIAAAALWGDGRAANIVEVAAGYREKSPADLASAMATSLIFVTFCYLGWNGSAYVASEMKDPQSTLPKSLLEHRHRDRPLPGLNVVYFYGAGVDGLSGQLNVGTLAAGSSSAPPGPPSLILGVSILTSASAMTVAGSRVLFAFGQDMRLCTGSPAHSLTAPWTALLLGRDRHHRDPLHASTRFSSTAKLPSRSSPPSRSPA